MRPRDRLLRHHFFMDEKLGNLSPLHRLLFEGLWTIADKEGRLEDHPAEIKIYTLPYDNCDPDKLLEELCQNGFISRYNVNGSRYIQIKNFRKHQKVHWNESDSQIPAEQEVNPTKELYRGYIGSNKSLISSYKVGKGKGKGKGKDDEIPYEEIISDLNNRAGKKFQSDTEATRKLIRGRWDEGHRLDDFKRVHLIKSLKWKDDKKMNDYLRPSTLYLPGNFENYLNEEMPEDEDSKPPPPVPI